MRTREYFYGNLAGREYRRYQRQMRRHRELRRKCLMLFMTLCLAVIFAVSYHSVRTSASTGRNGISFKYYTSISVAYGETLWEIADRYIDYGMYEDKSSYIDEVKNMNHLDERGTVKAGQYLIVPYFSSEFK